MELLHFESEPHEGRAEINIGGYKLVVTQNDQGFDTDIYDEDENHLITDATWYDDLAGIVAD